MSVSEYIFYFFAALTIVSGMMMLFTKNILYAAFLMLTAFLGIAAIYVFAGADFVALAQIVVYIGGILILIVFAVMISKRNLGEKFLLVETHHLFPALFLVILIIAGVSYVWYQTGGLNMVLSENVSDLPTVKQIGISFIIKYLLPFELAGLLLLIALIGASVIAGGLYHKNTAENKKK